MNVLNNMKTGTKLIGSFLIVAAIIIVVAVIGYASMKSINDGMTTLYMDRTLPIQQMARVDVALYVIRGDSYKYFLFEKERETISLDIDTNIKAVNDNIKLYKASQMVDEEKALIDTFEKDWAVYQTSVHQILTDVDAGKQADGLLSLASGGAASNARKAVGAVTEKLITLNSTLAAEINNQGDVTFASGLNLLIAISIAGVLMAVGLGLIISTSITKPLAIVVSSARSLSVGELLRDMADQQKDLVRKRKDEIGDIGKAFDGLINYMQEVGQAASTIAKNDLTISVEPKSQKDELGTAFKQMVSSLQEAIGAVAENSANLAGAASQLAQAANQAGQATSQISTTIQQIATGNAQQSESVNHTAASVEQMSHAIDGVAKGAQEQAASITKASTVTAQLTASIQQVSGNAAAVTRESAEAARAARDGGKIVQATIQGMHNIKAKVGLSTTKVQEMGSRSDQIGAIVETIDDIASQTNLLALNAAIEAARAGEHGKGFAVVADEVRKLAERSSIATKEIGGLIKNIQKTVNEAVIAMSESASEVENGVTQANNAGLALESIVKAVEAVFQQADQATRGTEKMNSAANELVSAVDSVSAVIEENTAATEQMSAGAHEVTQSIENIASVSEENSASVEEVSASAEEMSAQVEEVGSSANSLEEMAQALQDVVAQFKLNSETQSRRGAAPIARPGQHSSGLPASAGRSTQKGNNHAPVLPAAKRLQKV